MITSRRLAPIILLATVAACSSGSGGPGADTGDAQPAAAGTQPASASTAPADTSPTVMSAPSTSAAPAPPTSAPATTTPEPAPWVPIGRGDHEVGVATITIPDPAGDRPLTVEVWFPLDAGIDAGTLSPQQYTLFPGLFYESPAAFAATAEQIDASGSFPLIVYSHGSGGIRFIHSSYTEALASHGYVVAAPDHAGNTVVEMFLDTTAGPDRITIDRPTDVRRVIDAFVDPSDPVAGAYASHVDPDRIVVTGHSLGGFTSIALVTGFSSPFGDIAPDPRIDAIVPLAPAVGSGVLTDDLLASVSVPMMIVVGTNDTSTPVDPNVTRLWDLTTVSPAYRIELVAGQHQTFTDLCAYLEFLPTLPSVPEVVASTIEVFAEEGCSPGDIDAARAAELTNTYVLEFLDQVLNDGPPIDPTVVATPDDVIFDAR